MPHLTSVKSALRPFGRIPGFASPRPPRRRSARPVTAAERSFERKRKCAICSQTKPEDQFYREAVEPFNFRRECAACIFNPDLLPEQYGKFPEASRTQRVYADSLMMDYEVTIGQERFSSTMARLDQAARLAQDLPALAAAESLRNPDLFKERMDSIQSLLVLTPEDTRTLIRHQCDLLLPPPELLAERLLQLKLTVPGADVMALVQHGPWLLLLEDVEGELSPVLRKLQKMMPSFDVAAKLHEGGGIWWSASDMLRSNGRNYKYS